MKIPVEMSCRAFPMAPQLSMTLTQAREKPACDDRFSIVCKTGMTNDYNQLPAILYLI